MSYTVVRTPITDVFAPRSRRWGPRYRYPSLVRGAGGDTLYVRRVPLVGTGDVYPMPMIGRTRYRVPNYIPGPGSDVLPIFKRKKKKTPMGDALGAIFGSFVAIDPIAVARQNAVNEANRAGVPPEMFNLIDTMSKGIPLNRADVSHAFGTYAQQTAKAIGAPAEATSFAQALIAGNTAAAAKAVTSYGGPQLDSAIGLPPGTSGSVINALQGGDASAAVGQVTGVAVTAGCVAATEGVGAPVCGLVGGGAAAAVSGAWHGIQALFQPGGVSDAARRYINSLVTDTFNEAGALHETELNIDARVKYQVAKVYNAALGLGVNVMEADAGVQLTLLKEGGEVNYLAKYPPHPPSNNYPIELIWQGYASKYIGAVKQKMGAAWDQDEAESGYKSKVEDILYKWPTGTTPQNPMMPAGMWPTDCPVPSGLAVCTGCTTCFMAWSSTCGTLASAGQHCSGGSASEDAQCYGAIARARDSCMLGNHREYFIRNAQLYGNEWSRLANRRAGMKKLAVNLTTAKGKAAAAVQAKKGTTKAVAIGGAGVGLAALILLFL